MKAFFEEYRFAIVTAIVIIALVAIVNSETGIKAKVASSMSGLIDDFTSIVTPSGS